MAPEAVETSLPVDYPVETAKPRIDIRRAMAGVYALQGHGSMLRCCVKAGFSRKTARNLTQRGLSAEECIAEAAKLDPMLAPAKLLEGGRLVLAEQIAFRDPAKMAVRDAVKLFEATEKYFGGHELPTNQQLVTVADRLSQVAALLAVAQRRGLPVPRVEQPFVEAEVVGQVATAPAKRIPSTGDLHKCVDRAR